MYRKQFSPPRVLGEYSVALEQDLLGASITPSLNPIEILGQESFGEYDYSTGTFVDAWYD